MPANFAASRSTFNCLSLSSISSALKFFEPLVHPDEALPQAVELLRHGAFREGAGDVFGNRLGVGTVHPREPGVSILSAAGSLYANTYVWSLVSGPAGATLTNQNTAQATFTATADGTYVVQLVASNGPTPGAPARLTIVVDSALAIAPAAIRFADIKAVLQSTTAGCTNSGCHIPGGTGVRPPLFYSNTDRNGDGIVGDATDDLWFYTEVRGRINFTDLVASPILRKPSGNHHNGLLRPGFNTSVAPGQSSRTSYDLFLNWILNGAPQ